MKFTLLSNEEKASAIRELMLASKNMDDTKEYFSNHPELRDKEAGLFVISQARDLYMHFELKKEHEYKDIVFVLCSAGYLIGTEINDKEIIGEAALFMSDLWHEVGNPEEANRYKEIARNQKSIAKSHSDTLVGFKNLPSKKQDELIIPLIDLIHDKSKNFGNDYLYSHPELLHEDVVNWALNIAKHDFLIYQKSKNKDAFKVARNLSMVAFSISVEINNKDLVLSALGLLSNTYMEAGMKKESQYWEKMADQFRRR